MTDYDPALDSFHSYQLARQLQKARGVKSGVSDILILRGGHLHAIELKVPGKYPTPEQRAFMATVETNGGNAATCRSLDEVIGTVKAWGLT